VIGEAFGVLSDAEKRRRYDLIGPERSSSLRDEGSDRVRHRRHPAGFESDINADELFNMFFGGNGQFARPGLEGTLAVILASGR